MRLPVWIWPGTFLTVCFLMSPLACWYQVPPLTPVFSNTLTPTVTPVTSYSYVRQWGTIGAANGQFLSPGGVALDLSGNIYVVDGGNNRVQKFTTLGGYLSQLGSSAPATGNGPGQFDGPSGVAVDSSGTVYVADSNNHRIEKFDSSGTYAAQWDTFGFGPDAISFPSGIVLDGLGHLYVTDVGYVLKFTTSGDFLAQIGSYDYDYSGGQGTLFGPTDVALDASNYLYVVDGSHDRINKFTRGGAYVNRWGSGGNGNLQFAIPQWLAVDGQGYVYVSDFENNRIQKMDSNGDYVTQWGTYYSVGSSGPGGNGQFYYPSGIVVDPAGNVFVADQYNNRIEVFKPN